MKANNAQAMLEVLNRVHDYLGELIRDNLVEDTPRASDLADDVYDAIHGSHPTTEKSSAVGDAAAMREALKCIDSIAKYLEAGTIRDVQHAYRNIQDRVRIALSKPPRNCDKFGTDNVEAYLAYEDLCAKSETEESAADAIAWLLSIDQERANHGSK